MLRALAVIALLALTLGADAPRRASPIRHVVIVLQENRTFENIFHGYPGARTVDFGYDHAGNKVPLTAVHLMTPYDPAHNYKGWLEQYAGGAMNGFDGERIDFGSGAPKNFAYAYALRSDVQPYWDLAAEGSLADAFFADHRSQSFAGHQFPIAGASGPISPSEPDYYASGNPKGGQTCDDPGTGRAVNLKTGAEDETYTSCFDYRTIADLLSQKGLTWRFYVAAKKAKSYLSSFAVVKHIRDDPAQWRNVVSPATAIYDDAAKGDLANVSWVIGTVAESDHPGQHVPSSRGPNWVASVFNAIGNSPSWDSTLVILTYDDWGGWFDEMAPPQTFNAFEPGFRVPFVAVSPYCKRGYVSQKVHYMGSVLHYVESNFGLGSLGTSDARSDDLGDMFDYGQTPLHYIAVKPLSSAVARNRHAPEDGPPGLDPD